MLVILLVLTNLFWAALLAYQLRTCALLQRNRDAWMKIAEERKGMLVKLAQQIRKGSLQWGLVERIEQQFDVEREVSK